MRETHASIGWSPSRASREQFSERFEREAPAIAAVNHHHICSLYDVGPDYHVMEYVHGEGLHGPVPLARVLELAEQILDALAAVATSCSRRAA
jgi:eukaryotic-like serine/threonine-protein kinase